LVISSGGYAQDSLPYLMAGGKGPYKKEDFLKVVTKVRESPWAAVSCAALDGTALIQGTFV